MLVDPSSSAITASWASLSMADQCSISVRVRPQPPKPISEIKTIEEMKHQMIDNLMTEHQKAFADIKNYYNDITHNNLDLIKSLNLIQFPPTFRMGCINLLNKNKYYWFLFSCLLISFSNSSYFTYYYKELKFQSRLYI